MKLLMKFSNISILVKFIIHLCSMKIINDIVWSNQKDSTDVYRLIFNLPKLKYLKNTSMDSDDTDVCITLPMAINQPKTLIE